MPISEARLGSYDPTDRKFDPLDRMHKSQLEPGPEIEPNPRFESPMVRVERVVQGFFGTVKGLLTFFGGLESIQTFTGVFDKSKRSADLFNVAKELKLQAKNLKDMVGITNVRSLFYCPKKEEWFFPKNGATNRELLENINYVVSDVALPIIGSISFFAGKGLVSDRKNLCSLSCTILTVISLLCVIPNKLQDLCQNDQKVRLFERAQIVYEIAIATFNCSMRSSTFLFKAISNGVRAKVCALDGFYQFATFACKKWCNT